MVSYQNFIQQDIKDVFNLKNCLKYYWMHREVFYWTFRRNATLIMIIVPKCGAKTVDCIKLHEWFQRNLNQAKEKIYLLSWNTQTSRSNSIFILCIIIESHIENEAELWREAIELDKLQLWWKYAMKTVDMITRIEYNVWRSNNMMWLDLKWKDLSYTALL